MVRQSGCLGLRRCIVSNMFKKGGDGDRIIELYRWAEIRMCGLMKTVRATNRHLQLK